MVACNSFVPVYPVTSTLISAVPALIPLSTVTLYWSAFNVLLPFFTTTSGLITAPVNVNVLFFKEISSVSMDLSAILTYNRTLPLSSFEGATVL